jgi:ABC-type dipeptide/oligopeptide/nickel transport system permease subunit
MTNIEPPIGLGPGIATETVENAIELKDVEGLSQGQIVRRKFFRHKGALGGLTTLFAIIVLGYTSIGFGPVPGWWNYTHFTPYDIVNPGGRPTMHLPTWLGGSGFAIGSHPFGQDEVGRDIFAATMKGVQTSVNIVVIIGLISTVVGLTVGAIAGFYRGSIDQWLMRFTDLIITLPVLVIGSVLGVLVNKSGAFWLAVVLGLISWTTLARVLRAEFLTLREREFVDAARVAGASNFRIMFKHMIPNAMGVIVVNTTLLMSAAILLEAALSFLGFGVKDPDVSLGTLISRAETAATVRPWLFWWPGLFIIGIALSINLIGDGLRDAFDPRQKAVTSARKLAKAEAKMRMQARSADVGG